MKMKMEHRLAGISSGIGHNTVARLRQTLLFRDVGADNQQLSQKVPVLFATVLHRRDMLFRDDQRVHGRLWIDIVECQDAVVFMDDFRRNGFLHDLTK
jgi:hypothetical protein